MTPETLNTLIIIEFGLGLIVVMSIIATLVEAIFGRRKDDRKAGN